MSEVINKETDLVEVSQELIEDPGVKYSILNVRVQNSVESGKWASYMFIFKAESSFENPA